jgi:hypothetical protein
MKNVSEPAFSYKLLLCLLLLLASTAAVVAQQGAGAIVAIEEGAGKAVQQGVGHSSSGSPSGGTGKKASNTSRQAGGKGPSKPTTPPSVAHVAPKSFSGPILGDKYSFLNFEVADRIQPVHTNAAKAAGAKGLVQVEILVDTDGRVLSAHGRTGNKLLWPEAERAALASRLNRPIDNGRPARAMGFLVYRFGPADDDD